MGIVLNEYEWAEKMISAHDMGKKPFETLSRVAKYYYENKYSKNEVRRLLDNFLMQCDPNASLVHWSELLDRIAKNVGKYPLVQVDGIRVSAGELERIGALAGKQIRRLAFTLLCVSKYWDAVSESNNHWVNTSDKEIMQMANINTSIKRQSLMFAELKEAGMIRFSKKIDNINVQVIFGEDDGDTEMVIQDFRNVGYQYLMFCGEPYFECCNCGIVTKIQNPSRGRRQKYCPNCAVELQTKQIVDSVMRRRAAKKNKSV